jgi:hypothetical protein
MSITVVVLPEGKQVREKNPVPKPVAGFYDFNDAYDEEAFDKAKRKWQEAEAKLRTFDVVMVGSKAYPHKAAGINFWHLLPDAEHQAEILFDNSVKILS